MVTKPLALALSVSLVGGAALAGPVQAKTINACVKKKTGEVRIAKKCKKGWKKVTWNQKGDKGPQGQQGSAGAQGPATMVKTGTGQVLGRYLGLYPGGISIMFVLVNGGLYPYMATGQVLPFGSTSPSFKSADCTTDAFMEVSSPATASVMTGSAGGPSRIVWRRSSPTLGPPRAWEFSNTTQTINQPRYSLNDAGVCAAKDGGAAYNGLTVPLVPTTAPQDVPGPLTIG